MILTKRTKLTCTKREHVCELPVGRWVWPGCLQPSPGNWLCPAQLVAEAALGTAADWVSRQHPASQDAGCRGVRPERGGDKVTRLQSVQGWPRLPAGLLPAPLWRACLSFPTLSPFTEPSSWGGTESRADVRSWVTASLRGRVGRGCSYVKQRRGLPLCPSVHPMDSSGFHTEITYYNGYQNWCSYNPPGNTVVIGIPATRENREGKSRHLRFMHKARAGGSTHCLWTRPLCRAGQTGLALQPRGPLGLVCSEAPLRDGAHGTGTGGWSL